MNEILIIAGPSAIGKSTIADAIIASDPRFTYLRSATTRAPRGDGRDDEYIYYTHAEFEEAIGRGVFAEHMTYGGHRYGTRNEELKRAHSEGKIPLLVLDLEGVKSLGLNPDYNSCSVYVYDELDTIERRLEARLDANPTDERLIQVVEGRKRNNIRDYLSIDNYSRFIYSFIHNNETVEACKDKVLSTFHDFVLGVQPSAQGKAEALAFIDSQAEAKASTNNG